MKKTYRVGAYAIALLCVSSSFYIYEFFLRVMPSVITDELMREFGVNAGTMSIMTSCFLYSYALMQIPAGLLVDRYGPRLVLSVAVFICAISTVLFQATTHIGLAIISRLMLGAASSVAFIAPLTLASRWFPVRYLAFIAGCVQLLGCFGAIMGGAPIVILNNYMGWRSVMLWAAALGCVLSALFWFFIADAPSDMLISKEHPTESVLQQLYGIIYNRQILWIALAAFASWSAMGSLAELWGVPFLVKFHSLDSHEAALLVMIIWLGVAIGSPCAGWWTEYTQYHRTPLACLLLLSFITSIVLIYCTPSKNFILLNLFLMGCAAGAQPITFSLVALHAPPERIATAFGFNNMAVVCGASLLQPIIGLLLDFFWDGNTPGIRVYDVVHYQYALTIVPCSILLGIIACYYITEHTTHKNHPSH